MTQKACVGAKSIQYTESELSHGVNRHRLSYSLQSLKYELPCVKQAPTIYSQWSCALSRANIQLSVCLKSSEEPAVFKFPIITSHPLILKSLPHKNWNSNWPVGLYKRTFLYCIHKVSFPMLSLCIFQKIKVHLFTATKDTVFELKFHSCLQKTCKHLSKLLNYV